MFKEDNEPFQLSDFTEGAFGCQKAEFGILLEKGMDYIPIIKLFEWFIVFHESKEITLSQKEIWAKTKGMIQRL